MKKDQSCKGLTVLSFTVPGHLHARILTTANVFSKQNNVEAFTARTDNPHKIE